MRLEVLYVADCPHLDLMLERLAQVTGIPVVMRVIGSDEDAVRFGMTGSPTLLVDGFDPFATADQPGLSCRLYRDQDGRTIPVPSVEQLREAINGPSIDVLSSWRTRVLPLSAVEQATHRAILKAFASTGGPPAAGDLGTTEVLKVLHDVDAIRLTSYGEIAVAYPFSAAPTRHRVRIGDKVDVHAMCAIDALGIAPMLGQDTEIESVDATGRPITVVTRNGCSTWEPAEAVVFIGAEAGGGPSADGCCDHVNFFADRSTADAWVSAHPGVPGQIINQPEAEALAARLFGHLLQEPR
jgi:hypothetical protein